MEKVLENPLPGELHPAPLSFTADGVWVILGSCEGERNVPIPNALNGQLGQRTHVLRLHLPSGKHEKVYYSETGFSHLLICPDDPDFITYVPHGNFSWCMNLPREKRIRNMRVNLKTGEERPLLCPPMDEVYTHESWSPDGQRFFFFKKDAHNWVPASVCSVNREGEDLQVHYTTDTYQLGHGSCTQDGKFFLADCQKHHDSPLIWIDLQHNSSRIICWPNASNDGGHPASAHVHPSWSRSGKRICYTSDVSGTPQVYVLMI